MSSGPSAGEHRKAKEDRLVSRNPSRSRWESRVPQGPGSWGSRTEHKTPKILANECLLPLPRWSNAGIWISLSLYFNYQYEKKNYPCVFEVRRVLWIISFPI